VNEQEIKNEVSVLSSILVAKGYKWSFASAVIGGGEQLPGVVVHSHEPSVSTTLTGATMRDAVNAAEAFVNELSIVQVAA